VSPSTDAMVVLPADRVTAVFCLSYKHAAHHPLVAPSHSDFTAAVRNKAYERHELAMSNPWLGSHLCYVPYVLRAYPAHLPALDMLLNICEEVSCAGLYSEPSTLFRCAHTKALDAGVRR
jgi:hypothetical protein